MERCRPRRHHPETSEGGVRKAAVVLALDSKKRQTFKPDSFDNRPGRNLSESDTMVCEDSLVTLPRNRRVGSVGVFILCGNLWRYFHLRGSPILTLWGLSPQWMVFRTRSYERLIRAPFRTPSGQVP